MAALVLATTSTVASQGQSLSSSPTGGPVVSSQPPSSGAPSTPIAQPAQGLIADALAAGRIDYPTSLLYGAYAMFDDPQLPPGYAGNAAAEDTDLFAEIERAAASLPADVAEKLIPYTVRPTDPRWGQIRVSNPSPLF